MVAIPETNNNVVARERGFANLGPKIRNLAVERRLEDRLKTLAQLGRVSLAGHIDKAGYIPVELFPANKQSDARPLLQMQDSVRDLTQLVFGDLK